MVLDQLKWVTHLVINLNEEKVLILVPTDLNYAYIAFFVFRSCCYLV